MKRLFFIGFGLLLIGLLGCDKLNFTAAKKTEKKTALPEMRIKGAVIARVNNVPITLEELNQEIEAYNSLVPADKPELKITTREQKINYLKNDMSRRYLLYQSALDKGLDRNEDVLSAMQKAKMELLVVELIKQETEKIDVSSKEIEEYYNTFKEQFKEPEERQIKEIAATNEQEARNILVQLLQGADFATLAQERSRVATAKNGGDAGLLEKGKRSSNFDSVAFSETLDVGGVSSIFKDTDGYYYILKVEAKRGGKQKSLSELWDDIKRGLTFLKQQQKIEDLIGKLSRDAKLEFYEGEIK